MKGFGDDVPERGMGGSPKRGGRRTGRLPISAACLNALHALLNSYIIFFEKTLFFADEKEWFIRLFDERQEVKTIG